MPIRFYGEQRDKILQRLINKWLPGGPPVAILQGFPGCGKTQLALAVAAHAPSSLDPVEPIAESPDQMIDLFLDLAITLEAHGVPALSQELELGDKAKLDKVLLNILRHKEILIVVDEFQRLLPKDKSSPPQVWAKLVEDLNNSPHSRGRLLLISNRFIKTERWSENCHVEELQGLPDQEGEDLFTELLQFQGLEATVPPQRRREIAHRLGGNPRALKTLIVGLRTETLDELLSAAPDLQTRGDVVLDPGLVEDFERGVLERALPKLESDLLKFMRWLSVHRRPFKKEALQQFTAGVDGPKVLRRQLFDRFLLEQTAGGDAPHPLAREISVTRLRTERSEWKQAHSLAANYYFRYFKAQRLVGESNLATSYTELRHHLYEAGRIDELHEASEKLTKYAISQIGLVTPVPTNKESLEARISLISAIPDEQRPKMLQYHLARCLLKRGANDDKKLALDYARKATGRRSHSATWILQISLEYDLNGIDAALTVINIGLENVRPDEDAGVIYTHGGELLAKADRIDDAIKLLEEGIEIIPPAQSLFSLYQSCAELMAKADRIDEAIELLEKGIKIIPSDKGLSSLFQSCAELMAKADRIDDAIKLLEKGIEIIPPDKNLYILYQSAIEFTGKLEDSYKTESLVMQGLSAIPKGSGRRKIVETALRLFKARPDTEAIRRLLSEGGSRQLDPSERASANFALSLLSGDWEGAAEIARKAYVEFPFYGGLLLREADARLALGDVEKADILMKNYEIERSPMTRNNPLLWLKAFVSLIAGRPDEAKSIAALYAPDNYDPNRTLDETEMLRLWSVARGGLNAPIEDSFPGVVEYRRRIAAASEAEITETGPVLKTSDPLHILIVATEWNSRHGGLSTFNRNLCIALADAGAKIVCYVPEASVEEKRSAGENNVEIVEAARMPNGTNSLLAPPVELPPGFVPEVVIGHDRITGDASVQLATHHYPGGTRVLFIHTSPEEIEWHKEPREDSDNVLRAAERKRHQLKLAEGCDLVVTVGPRLTTHFRTDLIGANNPVPVMELTPGLPKYSPSSAATMPPPSIRCLVLGRVEDYHLKGLDLAAKAFGRVVSNWKVGNPPTLVVRGAPVGTGDELRQRLIADSSPTEIDIIIRHYSADEIEIRNDLREASLVLMPSRKEGFGLVGLEAISCGIPTLISDQSGLAETIRINARELANEWILPVMGENSGMKWAERIEFLINAREGAFARAAVLRAKLALELDWSQAATELLERLILQETD